MFSETEQRLYAEVNGWKFSGAIDRQEIDKKDEVPPSEEPLPQQED